MIGCLMHPVEKETTRPLWHQTSKPIRLGEDDLIMVCGVIIDYLHQSKHPNLGQCQSIHRLMQIHVCIWMTLRCAILKFVFAPRR